MEANGVGEATVSSGYLLQKNLEKHKISQPGLSTLAQRGDDELVEKFLTEHVTIGSGAGQQQQSQLYIASFWGFYDVVKSLIESGTNINIQNTVTLWTPLHAAAFQEHGKIVMYLLENGADPNIKDSEGRSPADFASASDKVWAHFAAAGCTRTPKHMLIKNRILKKFDPVTMKGNVESTQVNQKSIDTQPGSQNNGDVLANERSPRPEDRPDSGKRVGSALVPPWER